MTVENYRDKDVIFNDRFGITYKMLGLIRDELGTYIIYNDPKTEENYIEELETNAKGNVIEQIPTYSFKYIEDDKHFDQLHQLALKEGILVPSIIRSIK